MKENTIAFISGSVSGLLTGIGQQVIVTALLGLVGGFMGLAGKDIYNHFKFRKWQKRK